MDGRARRHSVRSGVEGAAPVDGCQRRLVRDPQPKPHGDIAQRRPELARAVFGERHVDFRRTDREPQIELSRNGGTTWKTLADSVPVTSPWTWPFVTPPPSKNCRVRVTALSYAGVSDTSNAAFTISCDVAADSDGDCDVDWDDWMAFEACATGPSISYQAAGLPEGAR